MGRPLSVTKRLKEIVRDFLSDYLGGKPAERKGKPAIAAAEMARLTQVGRARAERPTRDFDSFAYVQDLLANMPAAVSGLRQLAEDVTLDENGDARAWTLSVKVDPIEEEPTKEQRKKLQAFKDQAQQIFDDYARRTGVGYNAKHYVFKMLAAGDCFAEQHISLDSTTGYGRIERIRELPTWQMRVIWDELGYLQGYEQWQYLSDKVPVRWEIPAQVIHWKYHPTQYIPYGQTIFSHLRGRWEQFKLIELDAIAAIHTKSIDPEVHKLGRKDSLDRLSDEEVESYRQKLLDNPTDINRYYVVREGEADIEFSRGREGNAVLALISAHRDFENRFVEALGIPGHISGNIKDIAGRHVSNSLDQKYARRISSVRQDFTNYLRPSVWLEFALHGIDLNKPEQYGAKKISLDVTWPDLGESRTQRSKRVVLEWTVGLISHESALRQTGTLDPEGEIDQIKLEREIGDMPLAAATAISANNEQGKGVPTDGNEDETSGQAEGQDGDPDAASSRRRALMNYLMDDPQDIRQIIREELAEILGGLAEQPLE